MTKGVKGATINAIASSMPEFLTSLFFLFYVKNNDIFVDSFSGGLGVVAGSAVFNILIIPFAIIFFTSRFSRDKFSIDKRIITRDGLFLIVAIIPFIIIIAQEKLTAIHATILVLIYFIYFFNKVEYVES